MSIETLLSRLKKVKSTGKHRWICACPSHQDKSPSLAISVMEDGKALINCFAGCDTYSILQAVGLDWEAVFPEKATHQRQKPKKQILYASEALELIKFEAQIVLASAYQMRRNALTSEDIERLELSMQRINKVAQDAGL